MVANVLAYLMMFGIFRLESMLIFFYNFGSRTDTILNMNFVGIISSVASYYSWTVFLGAVLLNIFYRHTVYIIHVRVGTCENIFLLEDITEVIFIKSISGAIESSLYSLSLSDEQQRSFYSTGQHLK